MRNDQLSLAQELVSHANAFTQKSAGILPEIQNQTFQISHFIERLCDFVFRCFLKSGDVHVTDAGPNQEMQIDAVARNLIAHDIEVERLVRTFAQNCNADRCTFGSFQELSHIAGAHAVSYTHLRAHETPE